MRGFTPRLCLGFDDVAALPQVDVVIQILAGGRDSGSDTGLLK